MSSVTPDILRLAFFAIFGLGSAFMVATNIIAFRVLRPPKQLGFLWWHVTAISVSFLCLGTVVLNRTFELLGQGDTVAADWRTIVTGVGIVTFAIAQAIIFNVERSRLTQKIAGQRSDTPVVFDPVKQEGVPVARPDDYERTDGD